jgi:cysteine synthase
MTRRELLSIQCGFSQRGNDMPNDSRPAVLELIGNTPLVRVSRFDTGPCTLFLKLESQNPGGSIKDRIGLAMIDAAERDGRLQPGGTIVEATAGNTGLGLALVGRAKGYRVVLVVPDKMSTEKVLHLKAMGAEVHISRLLSGRGSAAGAGNSRRVLRRSIQQPGQPASPRMQHRAGDLGADPA